MTDDQITALAREYAEEKVDPRGFSKRTYEVLVDENAEYVEDVIRFLLRRYCLVEKETIRKEYQETCGRETYATEHKNELYAKLFKMKRLTLASLFPEIAKEVEE